MQGLALLNASEDRLTVIFPASSSLVPPTNSPIGCPTQQLASHAQPVRYAQPSSLTGPFSRLVALFLRSLQEVFQSTGLKSIPSALFTHTTRGGEPPSAIPLPGCMPSPPAAIALWQRRACRQPLLSSTCDSLSSNPACSVDSRWEGFS